MNVLPLDAVSSVSDFFAKNTKWIIVALVVLSIWWWFRPFFNLLFGITPEDAKLRSGGGDVTAAFWENRKNLARRLNETLTSNALLNSGRCEALYNALQLNPNQLRVLHNAYKNKYGHTLLKDVESTYTDDCGWLGMSDGLNVTFVSTLESLNLT